MVTTNPRTAFSLVALLGSLACAGCGDSDEAGEAEVLGVITVDLDLGKQHVRSGECLAGNLYADALREWAEDQGEAVDLAIINGGNIRFDGIERPDGIYPAGEWTTAMTSELLPFGNGPHVLTLTGAELRAVMEHSVAALPEGKGQFLHPSKGVVVEIDPAAPPEQLDLKGETIEMPGERITSLTVDGSPVESQASYRVVLSEYIAEGGDSFVTLAAIPATEHAVFEVDIKIALEAYIRRHTPVTPVLDGRIVVKD